MMHKLIAMALTVFSALHAGDQSRISKKFYKPQAGDPSSRGKKRNQKRMQTLEGFARDQFPGPDVQLNSMRFKACYDRRKRKNAWQEIILLSETDKPGCAEQIGAARALLQANVKPNMNCLIECGISFRGTPLINAARAGNKDLVALLLSLGADATMAGWFSCKRGFGKEFPLHGAARARKKPSEFEGHYPEVIMLLAEHGADVNAGGDSQEFPFAPIHMTVLQRPDISEDPEDRTARQIATLQALIKSGADLLKTTANGETALQLAKKRGNTAIAHFLEGVLFDRQDMQRRCVDSSDRRPVTKKKARRAARVKTRRGYYKAAQMRDYSASPCQGYSSPSSSD